MADSVNRIIPSTVAPEPYPILRRERDKRNGKEPQREDGGNQGEPPAPSASGITPAGDHDDATESMKDKAKGKILDINA